MEESPNAYKNELTLLCVQKNRPPNSQVDAIVPKYNLMTFETLVEAQYCEKADIVNFFIVNIKTSQI